MDRNIVCARLAQQVTSLVKQEKMTPIPGITLFYSESGSVRKPVMYKPAIVIVLQGEKTGYFGKSVIQYDASKYLMLTVPVPFECETFATPELPLAGLSLGVDVLQLQDLLIDIGDDDGFHPPPLTHGIHSALLTEEMLCATERLLDAMAHPCDARVLGPHIVREIFYHVLQGPCGGALLSLVSRQTQFSQIARALRRIEHHFTDSLSVDQLAAEANMSVSAFHHNFKAVTSTSPLQYLKSYRLHQARMMMLQEGMKAGVAALKVGYESPSQFSREFKRFFGVTPGEEMTRMRYMG